MEFHVVPDARLMRVSGMFLNAHMDLILYSLDDFVHKPAEIAEIVNTRLREHNALAPRSCLLKFVGVYTSELNEDLASHIDNLRSKHRAIDFDEIQHSQEAYRELASQIYALLHDHDDDPIVNDCPSDEDNALGFSHSPEQAEACVIL